VTTHTVFIVAGEPSGDLHGSNLVREILRVQPDIAFEGIGGEKMAAAGVKLRHDLAGEAIMGFTEVLRKLGHIRAILRDTVDWLQRNRPDLLILIDYPGFNLELAQRAKKLGIRTVYYISPQVWAWGKGRVRQIAALAEKVLVILDFEEKIYADAGVSVEYVGHPLVDHLENVQLDAEFIEKHSEGDRITLGLLPGSRPQEVKRHLPLMLRTSELVSRHVPESRFIVACPNERTGQLARQIVEKHSDKGNAPHVEVVSQKTYEVIKLSTLCLVASGTATLETAYSLTPMAVIYKTSVPSWLLARMLVRIEHIALVNILAKKRVVPEFIQFGARPKAIAADVLSLLEDDRRRAELRLALKEVKDKLGVPGASARAARIVVDLLKTPAPPLAVTAG
jgi:lipid-A-disaccharide synthase